VLRDDAELRFIQSRGPGLGVRVDEFGDAIWENCLNVRLPSYTPLLYFYKNRHEKEVEPKEKEDLHRKLNVTHKTLTDHYVVLIMARGLPNENLQLQ
jgi:hypothetical protein